MEEQKRWFAGNKYLRHFDKQMLGDAERIITDGTSAGGAMSALMGATGNNPEYAEILKAMASKCLKLKVIKSYKSMMASDLVLFHLNRTITLPLLWMYVLVL